MFSNVITAGLMTADELARLSIPDKQVELVRGRLVVREPPGTWHGGVAGALHLSLGGFVQRQKLGMVFPQDTGFKIANDPDTVRAPDVAFVARERLAAIGRQGYAELAPDLAVEVLSPRYRAGEILAKVAEWLEAGTRLVWVIDPGRQEAWVYRSDGSISTVGLEDSLDGEDILPGFSCPLESILNWPPQQDG